MMDDQDVALVMLEMHRQDVQDNYAMSDQYINKFYFTSMLERMMFSGVSSLDMEIAQYPEDWVFCMKNIEAANNKTPSKSHFRLQEYGKAFCGKKYKSVVSLKVICPMCNNPVYLTKRQQLRKHSCVIEK